MINRCRSEFDGDTHINAFGFDVAAAGSRIFEFVVIVRQIQLYIGYQSTAQADFIAVGLVALPHKVQRKGNSTRPWTPTWPELRLRLSPCSLMSLST